MRNENQLLLIIRHYEVWLSASLDNTFCVLGEMKALGFEFVELEGVRRENLLAVKVTAAKHGL